VVLQFTDAALVSIARQAISRGTGARGLRGVMEALLRKTVFELPSMDSASECLVDGEVGEDGEVVKIAQGQQ
jgi:ATP-dependent Clp protease ATP-binding subunit ClpX